MKVFVITLLISFVNLTSLFCQSATGDCSSVQISNVPPYPTVYFAWTGTKNCNDGGGYYEGCDEGNGPACCRIIVYGEPVTPRVWLERLEANGTWSTVSGPQHSTTFSNVAHGTYRVKCQVPNIAENACPPSVSGNITKSRMCLFNLSGQFIGYWGTWDNTPFNSAPPTYTNSVIVGIVVTSDIAFNFVDGGGGDNIPNGFDYDELVRMDASASKNYNAWWLAIFELGGQQRYRSNGWTSGQVGMIDLTALWNGGPADNWHFETLNSYMIQFAIVNEQCQIHGQWTNLDKAFFVCPTGSGYKFKKPENSISIYPNPVNHHFRFTGIDFTPINKFEYEIRSMDGKLVKRQFILDPSTNYSLDGVQSGIYLVSLYKDDQRIFNTKLSVVK